MPDMGWVRPSAGSKRPVWGFANGIQVSLWPDDIELRPGSDGGPRGLLRIGYPVLNGGHQHGLINFIAIEPVVKGARCFSELEPSSLRDGRGKLIWTGNRASPEEQLDPGSITPLASGIQKLSVTLYVEPFVNGAKVQITMEFRSDRPDEVTLIPLTLPDSAPLDSCILTATMGNYMRLRRIWLKDHQITPADQWPSGNVLPNGFTEDIYLSSTLIMKDKQGGLLALAETNEQNPSSVPADPRGPYWHYRGEFPLTQYWRYPQAATADTVKLRMNGRKAYWAGSLPVPGGMAYENFDLTAPYTPGQQFIFGLSKLPASTLIPLLQTRQEHP